MKKILIMLFLFVFNEPLLSQIVVNEFVYERGKYRGPIKFHKFKNTLLEELSKSFYILENDINIPGSKIDESRIIDYFRNSINPDFEAASYILNCEMSPSIANRDDIFRINVEVIEVQTRKKYIISGENIIDEDMKDAALYISKFLVNTIPTYYPIVNFNDNNLITIRYGSDRNAEEGDEFELVSLNGIPVGEIEVEKVHGNASFCDFELYDFQYDFNRHTFKNFYARTITSNSEAEYYRDKLSDLSNDPEDFLASLSTPKYDVLTLTVNNFYFKKESIKDYFDKETYTPMIFGGQLNLLVSKKFSLYLKGRVSLISEIQENNPDYGIVSSNFSFFQGGGGIQFHFPVSNILYPGVGLSAQYMEIVISKEREDVNLTSEHFQGFDAELNAHCILRVYDFFGIYGELAYHYYPLLKGNDEDWNTTAFSVGLGLTYFM